MKKAWVGVLCLALAGTVAVSMRTATAASPASDQVKLASLVNDMKSMDATGLQAMEPIPIRKYELPGPGVDVMRARLEETYSVDGVGRDTVELTGWIAVTHGQAYPKEGASEINWNTAILPTQFVAMDLNGTSKLFGPVHVGLDADRPSYGKVGRIEIPELAKQGLQARLVKNEAADANTRQLAAKDAKAAPQKDGKAAPQGAKPAPGAKTATPRDPDMAAMCEASANVKVQMPQLGIDMKTEVPVLWYSLVDTIPPVGHTASIAIQPVRLISNGRGVATLESGVVKFREVVRHVNLSSNAVDRVAAK